MALNHDVEPSQLMSEYSAVEPRNYSEVKLDSFVWFSL